MIQVVRQSNVPVMKFLKFYFERYVMFSTLLDRVVHLGLADCSSELHRF